METNCQRNLKHERNCLSLFSSSKLIPLRKNLFSDGLTFRSFSTGSFGLVDFMYTRLECCINSAVKDIGKNVIVNDCDEHMAIYR